MRTLVRLRGTREWGKVHAGLEAAVHLCCHQLLPSVKAQFRRRGAVGEASVELAAAALAACRRPRR
ncbi:hypothetical protein F1721_01055 [Saccharopolyspora hirsuta]|uniref:Uncharacterized protein n=1 Tax=Saccharopolyspora hirsuta TaxID=1837 RepID=A0A5M7CEI7_SACHI|nr:hypothetical protein [Saccharopolyspora hirsuta]KAA5838084.1 hypothetical protein F1721_01055 [Saccharopolyspora hirsuta]